MRTQVTFDTADPHRSAFPEVAACSDPAGVEPRLCFQKVPEGKTAKNRVHLDIHVERTINRQRLLG